MCTPATRPEVPYIDAGILWDGVGPDMYDELKRREILLVDWALENQAIADVVCEK